MGFSWKKILGVVLALPTILLLILYITLNGASTASIRLANMTNRTIKIPPPVEGLVCISFEGRLGNQMFEYASMYGIARKNNRKILVGRNDLVNKVFNISALVTTKSNYCSFKYVKKEKHGSAFDSDMTDIRTEEPVKLAVYLQSWKYFMSVSDEIRQEFTFRNDIMKRAKLAFETAVRRRVNGTANSVYVGVHIRHGDIKLNGINLAPVQYLLNATAYFRNKFSNVVFLICSDSMEWVKGNLGKRSDELGLVYVEGNSAEVDMAVLGMCNHTIMTVGTFSWWAAWLAGGITIYYTNFIGEGPVAERTRSNFNGTFQDYFMPDWIGMP